MWPTHFIRHFLTDFNRSHVLAGCLCSSGIVLPVIRARFFAFQFVRNRPSPLKAGFAGVGLWGWSFARAFGAP